MRKLLKYTAIALLMPFVFTFAIAFSPIIASKFCIEAWKKLTKILIK